MIHLKKDRCGYLGYKCKRISYSDSLSWFYDSTPYSGTPPNTKSLKVKSLKSTNDIVRSNFHNYYNIPSDFTGVINDTKYIDLTTGYVFTSLTCVELYNPFTEKGLINKFDEVGDNQSFIAAWGDFKTELKDYTGEVAYSTTILYPGILTPKAALSDFNTAATIVVPTNALASKNTQDISALINAISGLTKRISNLLTKTISPLIKAVKDQGSGGGRSSTRDVQSGCLINGFYINYSVEDKKPISLDIDKGTAIVNGVEKLVRLGTISWAPTVLLTIQIYLKAVYNIMTGLWNFSYVKGDDLTVTTVFCKIAMLGTAHYYPKTKTVDIIQGVCSPVFMDDYVSGTLLPKTGDTTLYLFAHQVNSTKFTWAPVGTCKN